MSIKEISEIAGKKTSEIAKELGIPPRTMQQWVAGDHLPPQYVINLIAEHYGVKI